MLKQFAKYYIPHRKLAALDIGTAFFRAMVTICVPFLVRRMLKDYLPSGNFEMIIWTLAGLITLVVMISLTTYINIKWGHVLGTRMETDMRSDLFRHLQKLSFKYFDTTKTGHIMSRISNDLFNISEIAHHCPEDLFISIFLIGGAFSFMFAFNSTLACIALIPLPFLIGLGSIFRTRMRQGFRVVRKRIADINSNVENSIQGIREVKAYTNEEYEIDKFCEVNSDFRHAKENMYSIMGGFHSGMMFLTEMYYLIVIAGGVFLIHKVRIDLADLIAFLLYIRFILSPIQKLINFVEQYQQGAASFERFVEVMHVEPDISDHPNAIRLPSVKGRISVRDVSFRYAESGDWVLKNINMEIQPGQTVALVGESGAGKSTLVSLLPRFYEVDTGEIMIDGHNVKLLKKDFLRESIGLVQQSVFLFDSTIRDNIMFGRPDAAEDELIEAARNANIYDFIQSQPKGFDSLVGEHGVKLSGGQKQRVSIARVFLKNPPILIFDEATAYLDAESEELIREAMTLLCQSRTTIIIAHRLSTVKNAEHTYVIRNGSIVEQGRHQDLLEHKGYYNDLYSKSLF